MREENAALRRATKRGKGGNKSRGDQIERGTAGRKMRRRHKSSTRKRVRL
jgi:hypothetical protein